MKKIVIGCLGGDSAFVVVAVALIWLWLFRELPVLDASLSLPSETPLGSEVTMVITTTNNHTEALVLDSIDIDDSFLEGFQVVDIQPEPSGTTHLFGQRSWGFGKSVDPGESLDVRFRVKAVQEGHFSGDIDVCNPNQDFQTLLADVVIKSGLSGQRVEGDVDD